MNGSTVSWFSSLSHQSPSSLTDAGPSLSSSGMARLSSMLKTEFGVSVTCVVLSTPIPLPPPLSCGIEVFFCRFNFSALTTCTSVFRPLTSWLIIVYIVLALLLDGGRKRLYAGTLDSVCCSIWCEWTTM